jgi:hypothetical protein
MELFVLTCYDFYFIGTSPDEIYFSRSASDNKTPRKHILKLTWMQFTERIQSKS